MQAGHNIASVMAQHHLKGGPLVDSKRGLASIATNPAMQHMQHLASPHPRKFAHSGASRCRRNPETDWQQQVSCVSVACSAMQHMHTHRRQTAQRLRVVMIIGKVNIIMCSRCAPVAAEFC